MNLARKVLRVLLELTVWTELMVLVALLVPLVQQEWPDPLVRRDHKVPRARRAKQARRERPDLPAHLAARVQSGPRVIPDHLAFRVRPAIPAHLDRFADRGSTSKRSASTNENPSTRT